MIASVMRCSTVICRTAHQCTGTQRASVMLLQVLQLKRTREGKPKTRSQLEDSQALVTGSEWREGRGGRTEDGERIGEEG